MITLKSKYWTYKPGLIPPYVFEPFYEIIKDYCQVGVNRKRISCVFGKDNNSKDNNNNNNNNNNNILYNYIPNYLWSDAPSILVEICKLVEQYTNEIYDYVLVHIYTSGQAGISWHNDSEALDSSVASVSLGATRKFRLKTIGRKKGWDTEISLTNGDLVWMHGPDPKSGRLSCQRVYQHTVPVEKKIKEPRINLTFRQYSKV